MEILRDKEILRDIEIDGCFCGKIKVFVSEKDSYLN